MARLLALELAELEEMQLYAGAGLPSPFQEVFPIEAPRINDRGRNSRRHSPSQRS